METCPDPRVIYTQYSQKEINVAPHMCTLPATQVL